MSDTDLYERINELALRIGEISRKVDFIMSELKLDYRELESSEFNEIQKLLKANRKIDAIKVYRERYNVSLADAKTAVERIEMGLFNR